MEDYNTSLIRRITDATAALYRFNSGGAAGSAAKAVEAGRRQWFAEAHERGPWAEAPDKCPGKVCTGSMPSGHVWYWENEDHTGGFLAHTGTGRES